MAPASSARVFSGMPETPRPRIVSASPLAPLEMPVMPRNTGTPLELDWIEEVRVNRSAVERRAATLRTRRTVKKEWQAAWLLRAITLMDLTTLSGDDTPGRVRRLCAKARRPVREDLLEALGAEQLPIRVGAVCVYHTLGGDGGRRARRIGDSGRGGVHRISRGALTRSSSGSREIRASVAAGADEIDIVITRAHVLTGELARALRRSARLPRRLRRRAHQDDPRHRRARHAAQRGAREPGVHDGRRRFHQDFHRQGDGERHAPGRPGDGARRSASTRERTGYAVGLQARRRHPRRQGGARVAGADEGGAGRPLAASRAVPLRRQRAAHRHRAPARALRDRALLGGTPPPTA